MFFALCPSFLSFPPPRFLLKGEGLDGLFPLFKESKENDKNASSFFSPMVFPLSEFAIREKVKRDGLFLHFLFFFFFL